MSAVGVKDVSQCKDVSQVDAGFRQERIEAEPGPIHLKTGIFISPRNFLVYGDDLFSWNTTTLMKRRKQRAGTNSMNGNL